jgi:hypothetical protein
MPERGDALSEIMEDLYSSVIRDIELSEGVVTVGGFDRLRAFSSRRSLDWRTASCR